MTRTRQPRHGDGKIDVLRQVPLLAGASRRELRRLAATADLVSADAGQSLRRAGGHATVTYIVVDSTIEIIEDGRTVASVRRGQVIPDTIPGQPVRGEIVTASDATLLAIHCSHVPGLLAASASLRTALKRDASADLRSRRRDARDGSRRARSRPAAGSA
jgi:nitrous oxidase accessory protein NosD